MNKKKMTQNEKEGMNLGKELQSVYPGKGLMFLTYK